MAGNIQCENFELYCSGEHNNIFMITIRSLYKNRSQGILSLENRNDEIWLYKWYNEGKFPDFFDTISDDYDSCYYRLRIVGVDEV
jgi:hypothetical protein